MDSTAQTEPYTSLAFLKAFWPILIGLLVLYAPTYYALTQTLWIKEDGFHGPMVLIGVAFLFWQKRSVFLARLEHTHAIIGGFILGFGLLIYIIGRSQDILILEIGSQIPILLGSMLITLGTRSILALWFPLFFLLFMIPLPGFIVDVLTTPLKEQISAIATGSLYSLGYPIARNGVVLTIGSYQLLVADACSGLHSMFSLSAMGLLYLYLLHYPSKLKNTILIACILPIAFIANVIRVIILVLVTYHFGDEAGQGFLHGFAGIILFAAALALLFTLDGLLDLVIKEKQ